MTTIVQNELPLGEQLAAEGIAETLSHLTLEERRTIVSHILTTAAMHTVFSSDDVRAALANGHGSILDKLEAFPNALGGMMQSLARRENLIEQTGSYVKSHRADRRGGKIALWRGVTEDPR